MEPQGFLGSNLLLRLGVHHDEIGCLVEKDFLAQLLTAPVFFGSFRVLCTLFIKVRSDGQKVCVALHLDLEIALNCLWAFEGHTPRGQTLSQLIRENVFHVSAVHNLPLVAFEIWRKHHSVQKKKHFKCKNRWKTPFFSFPKLIAID